MKKKGQKIIIFLLFLFLFQFIAEPVLATGEITVELYYKDICGSCRLKRDILLDVKEVYIDQNDTITFILKDIAVNATYKKEHDDYGKNYSVSFPFIVISNSTNLTVMPSSSITFENLNETIAKYLAGVKPDNVYDKYAIEIDFLFWHAKINISDLSLPILTIVLGGVDSFNPCAFFILIILLGLLLHANSRRRMLLIGGIFIFFSGLLYAVFMFVLFNVFMLTRESVTVITIIAGLLAITLGVLDIKDFFFFKKGASVSIPDDKKTGIYRQMRNLVKNPRLAAVIFGTIVLAGTVNFYELICTLGLPLVFTQKLSTFNLSTFDYYMYILFYNIVYVIPLIIIVLIFVFTMGRIKLTEMHGRSLKLLAGTMLTSFGVIMLVDYQILENVITPIALLFASIVITLILSKFWKKKIDEEENKKEEV